MVRSPELYRAPDGSKPPPKWIRAILMLTCTGVSFAHGSNDGQKGMGLIVLILVGLLPGTYALKMNSNHEVISGLAAKTGELSRAFARQAKGMEINGEEAKKELSSFC